MKICIIDKIGLCYDGTTLEKQGLGGSESAVIYIATELAKLNFDVTVFNNCIDSTHSSPGVYNGVRYIDNTEAAKHSETYDIAIVSRTVVPFLNNDYPFLHSAKKRILWLHDTFVDGDQYVEDLAVSGKIDHIFTLSDWHTTYILNAAHGKRRNFEVLKKKIFQTRNGAQQHIKEVNISRKDRNHFVYNASASKGMLPLINDVWPEIKKQIPKARLTIIGGYYRFREGAAPDEQEKTVSSMMSREDLKEQGVEFTGVIRQSEIAKILANASLMLYPGAFPETFGISSLESLLYNTPLVTTRFGALEETAIEQACYLIDYAIEPNGLFPHIDKTTQVKKFLDMFFYAYNNPYILQQKQNYCNVVKDVAGWNTVAIQWKQFFYRITDNFLPVDEYRQATRINQKVARVFGRTNSMPHTTEYKSFCSPRPILVVSPFWNAESYIQRNILSVAQQDYTNYTHVLIDDKSTDNSYAIAEETIKSLPKSVRCNFILLKNNKNLGAIQNQLSVILDRAMEESIVMLLDGDDWLVNNNTIFHYYNDIYDQGYEFTYGSMWSVADSIPLIAQEYPESVKEQLTYRDYLFNWKIPYTHLRTCLGKHFMTLDHNKFKVNGRWMKSGHDNPLFYELIERVDPDKVYCNREIVCNYNDLNPNNDYKIHSVEQNQNANTSYEKKTMKKILIAIPTNRYIEPETFKSIYDLDIPEGYTTEFQFFYGYQIDQIRNLIAEWARRYDYLFSVDSDIILPKDALTKMLAADCDIVTGMYIQRIPDTHTLELYMVTPTGGMSNIPYEMIEPHRGLVEIAGCGFGCCLVKGEVFRTLEYPHFFYKSALTMHETVSEDVYFCMKAREHGFKVWVDTTIVCDHKGSVLYKVRQDKISTDEEVGVKVIPTNETRIFK